MKENKLNKIIDWVKTNYTISNQHEAGATESSYFSILYNGILACKIRFSSHLAAHISTDLIIVDSINSDTYVVYLKNSTMPLCFSFDELIMFIKHFVLIQYSEKVAKETKDASTQLKTKIEQEQKQKIIENTPVIDTNFKLENSNFDDPNYRDSYWQDFKKLYLIKKFPRYTTYTGGILDLFKKVYAFNDQKNHLMTLSYIEELIVTELNKTEDKNNKSTINNTLQYVYSKYLNTIEHRLLKSDFITNYNLRVENKNNIDKYLSEKKYFDDYNNMTIKQKEVILNLLMHDISFKLITEAINTANRFGRDIKKMKRAAESLIKQNENV